MIAQFCPRRLRLVATAIVAAGVTVLAGAGIASSAGGPKPQPVVPQVGQATPTHFNGNVRHIPAGNRVQPEERQKPRSPNEPARASGADTVVQAGGTAAPAPAPSSSFSGLDFANWGAGWPPDTNGDVGPTYYVQTVNTSIGIFDKSTGSRVAAFTFNDLFSQSPTGTPCDKNNQGDPVALYDPIGDRWIISDFAWSNYTSGAMYQCMAVSKTGDPVSGGWYFYAWKTETGGVLPDYPKLGVWPDAIYMSANDFATTGVGSYRNAQVWAFDRTAMESGAAAKSVTFNLPKTSGGVTVFSLLPSNMRVATGTPPAGSPNYFASIYGSYAIRVWKFHVDWVNTASSTFTGPTNVPIATFNVGPSTVPEKGGNNLDTLSYRLMMQNQYTNLNGTESLWLTHTVGSGGTPNVAKVRWYQLPVTGGTIASAPAQQSTWSPDSKNRFMPSLAVDKNGDMAIGYSVSDSAMYPSIRYAGRLVGDPAGTLGQSETSLIEGTGFQCCKFSDGSTNTRWGDYSAMTIDPDGCTFWYTSEYYDTQPTSLAADNWKTRFGSFSLPGCGAPAPPPPAPAAPTISSFAPTSGPPGTAVTISGTSFSGATVVAFNGTAAGYTVDSATQITATVPPGASSGPIAVTTPGGTATSATSFTVTTPATPITNGDFETGTFSGWTTGGGNPTPTISTAQAHSATHSALLGYTPSSGEPNGDGWIQQQFSVPAAGGTLSFYVWEFTTDSISWDWQTCQLRSTSGSTLATIFKDAGNGQTWQQKSYSLANWKGQTIVVWCNVHEDGWGDQTYMYVDDFAVN
jgi:hypothetical protein